MSSYKKAPTVRAQDKGGSSVPNRLRALAMITLTASAATVYALVETAGKYHP
jgi:hypothetical protein